MRMPSPALSRIRGREIAWVCSCVELQGEGRLMQGSTYLWGLGFLYLLGCLVQVGHLGGFRDL